MLNSQKSPFPDRFGVCGVQGISPWCFVLVPEHIPRFPLHKPKTPALQLLSLLPQLCSAFTVEQATYNHVKIHHGYTNIIGLGDSSTWKLPFLNRYVYMFLAPLAVPILTPLVALGTCPPCLGTAAGCGEAWDVSPHPLCLGPSH